MFVIHNFLCNDNICGLIYHPDFQDMKFRNHNQKRNIATELSCLD